MEMKLVNVGFGNTVNAGRVIAIVNPESSPMKRLIQGAKEKGILVTATFGRKTRAIVVMDSGHIILSALQPETIANRFLGKEKEEEEIDEEEKE